MIGPFASLSGVVDGCPLFYGGTDQPTEQKHKEEEWNERVPHKKMPPGRSLKRTRRNVPLVVFVEDDRKTGEVCRAHWMIVVVFDSIFHTTIIVLVGWWVTWIDSNSPQSSCFFLGCISIGFLLV